MRNALAAKPSRTLPHARDNLRCRYCHYALSGIGDIDHYFPLAGYAKELFLLVIVAVDDTRDFVAVKKVFSENERRVLNNFVNQLTVPQHL